MKKIDKSKDSKWMALSMREKLIQNMRVYLMESGTFRTTKGYKSPGGWKTVTDLLFVGRLDGGFNIFLYNKDGTARHQIPLSRISEVDCAIINKFITVGPA